MNTPGNHTAREWINVTGSSQGGNCVEMRRSTQRSVDVRDSKNPDGPMLTFSTAQFTAWLNAANHDEYPNLTD